MAIFDIVINKIIIHQKLIFSLNKSFQILPAANATKLLSMSV